ncbi:MAG: flagellar hook-associated protein FlgK [Bradyrhizobium sp.]|nr:flagellar hook-associated protein FlgK [Bradyrhizobium sp.]
MSLSSALSIAMSGLSASQAGLSIVSSNVANASTPGYVSQSLNLNEYGAGSVGTGVQVAGITRALDTYVQSQLRTETSGGGYADQMSSVLQQLQTVYGTPGGQGTLETAFSNLTTAVQGLAANSGAYSSQSAVVTAAQNMAQELNSTTQGIQALRTNVQQDIATSVASANADMTQIANLNTQLQGLSPTDPSTATLEDQRDTAINQLAKLVDVRVSTTGNNQVSIYTNSGVQLVGAQASTLSFNGPATLGASNLYNTNPTQNGVGTITLTSPSGATTDMDATNGFSSGQIAADLKLRDTTLVQAQNQVDQLAASVSSALSDTTTAGTAVTSGTQAGFTLDLTNMQPGNTINLTYTNTATGAQQQLQIVAVGSSSVLPLPTPSSTSPNTAVVGVNVSGGMASIVSQLNAALGGANLQFSNPSGSTLQVLNGTATGSAVSSASATITTSSLTSGSAALPLFTDGNALYTGAITSSGSQLTGYAGRITVNPAVVANPSSLTVYSTSPATASGDTTRADFINSQLTTGSFTYSPVTGLGSSATPFTGTITSYMQQFLGLQGSNATNAQQLAQGQDVVVNTLQQSYNTATGVNMDAQMSNLISLQNAYSANAHVMAVVQSMFTTLLQAQR